MDAVGSWPRIAPSHSSQSLLPPFSRDAGRALAPASWLPLGVERTNCAIRQGAKNLDSSRMREARGQFENWFDRLRSSPEDQAECFNNFLGSTFALPEDGRYSTRRPSRRQVSNPRASSARALTGRRHRQAHALGDSGYGLVWLPDQESECLQAFAVSQNTAGAPKRRLTRRRRHGVESYPHTLQSVTNWSTRGLRFKALNHGFSISIGVCDIHLATGCGQWKCPGRPTKCPPCLRAAELLII